MKFSLLVRSVSFAALIVSAANATTLTTGVPANSLLATPTAAWPQLGGANINFDSLTPNTSLAPGQYASQGVTNISSPDGLQVIPFSTQSAPNEVFDNSATGTANITINLAGGTSAIGIGIADSDPVTIFLQALDVNGHDLGGQFAVTISETTSNPGNGYFVLSDTSNDIYGLLITQPTGNAAYSGLAIDDLQTAPEPGTFALLGLGIAAAGFSRLRKRV